jgi:creatinine amidohydrolase
MLVRWDELTKDQFEQYRDTATVAINFASTEQHSRHLPVGTDAIIGGAVLEEAARLAMSPVVVLPQVRYGYSPHHRFAPGYVTISQKTLVSYARDICQSVHENGFKRMFMVNSHGGNQVYLTAVVNEIGEEYGDSFSLMELRYWDIASSRIMEIRDSAMGGAAHAGEFETSMIMHLRPELVQADTIVECDPVPGDPWFQMDLLGSKKYFKFSNFNKYNPEGHVGQPHLASAEKGRLFFEAVTEELAGFFDHFRL